jgi:hypothetical protein
MKRRFLCRWFALCAVLALAGTVLAAPSTPEELQTDTVAAGVDLVLATISGPTKAYLNQTISVTFEVKNQGDADSGAYQVVLYLSADTTIDPAQDRLLKQVAFPGGLPAGETKKTTTKVTIPAGGLSGLYYYGGVVGSSSIASVKKVSMVRFQASAANGTVTDHKTGLMWQQADDGIQRSWAEAKAYCDELVHGGHEDWHLPRIDELLTIVDYSRRSPAIDPVFDCRSFNYWSSSIYTDYPDNAWYVYFHNGYTHWYKKSSFSYFVRCARGGPW